MLNIFNLICIWLNFVLHSSGFVFAKLPEGYAIFIPIIHICQSYLFFFLFLLAFVWQVVVSFR
ncbi:hypothetical protein Syun_001000 [Stephania yunnanensis]|uniref:Uncharacterized protein n=1 Tax=Stephania yunnanensis TaxID=152371 RepID=A0AAP0LDZ2_9MAGN